MTILVVSFTVIIIIDEASMMPINVSSFTQYNPMTATTFMDSTTVNNAILLVNQSGFNNKMKLLFVNTNILCQNTIELDPGSSNFDNRNIKCVEELLKKCEPFELYFLYGLGSMKVSIKGKENNLCSILILHEIEMGENRFNCLVPLDKVSNWSSWKNSNGLGAIDDILAFCSNLNR